MLNPLLLYLPFRLVRFRKHFKPFFTKVFLIKPCIEVLAYTFSRYEREEEKCADMRLCKIILVR